MLVFFSSSSIQCFLVSTLFPPVMLTRPVAARRPMETLTQLSGCGLTDTTPVVVVVAVGGVGESSSNIWPTLELYRRHGGLDLSLYLHHFFWQQIFAHCRALIYYVNI